MRILSISNPQYKNSTQISHKATNSISKNTVKPLLAASLTALGTISSVNIAKNLRTPPVFKTKFPNGSYKEEQIFQDNSILSVKYNFKGEKETVTVITPAKIQGEFNIKELSNNKETIVSSVKKRKNNGFIIEKNFTSPDGIKTHLYKAGEENNYKFEYKITDSDGSDLFNLKREYKRLDNNRTLISINHRNFINEFGILGVESKELNENKNIIGKNFMIVNWRFEDLLKKFPADLFYCMGKNHIRLNSNSIADDRIAIMTSDNELVISPYYKDDSFVIAHEIGHVKNKEIRNLENDNNLIKIFKEEKENAKNNMGDVIKDEAEYFIFKSDGLNEIIAETYAILSGLDHNGINNPFAFRKNILMKYFPKTIAYIAKNIFIGF